MKTTTAVTDGGDTPLRHPARWITTAIVALALALSGWAMVHDSAAVGDAARSLIGYFRGPVLPTGFTSGNGRIEATEYDIASKRAGRIATVTVREGDMVTAGQVLALMDTRDLEADLHAAQAQRTQAREEARRAAATIAQRQSEIRSAVAAIAQRESEVRRAGAAVAQRRSGVDRARAAVAQRESELSLARKELRRSESLFGQDLIARQKLDEDLARVDNAAAALAQERAGVDVAEGALLEAQVQAQIAEAALVQEHARREAAEAALTAATIDVASREAAIAAAAARVERIQTDIDDSTLRTPVPGRVLYRLAEPGEVVAAGGKIVTVLELTDVYMTIFLPTEQAGRVVIDAPSRIVLDAAPHLVIPAAVSFVASRAQFTPKQVETRAEREKLMFRVKVRIDPAVLARNIHRVKTGVPGVAYVRLDPQAEWPPFLDVKLDR